MDGHKELLGLWMLESEGAKFWLSDDAATKVIYLATQNTSKNGRCRLEIGNRHSIDLHPSRGGEVIEFEGRLSDYSYTN